MGGVGGVGVRQGYLGRTESMEGWENGGWQFDWLVGHYAA